MRNFARFIDALALRALEREVTLDGKPGLVTSTDCGSHDDMDLLTFHTSIAALTGYFGDCVRLGAADSDFTALQQRGLAAERAMFAATDGINTHRGAVFTLGLLCAAAGRQRATTGRLRIATLGRVAAQRWGEDIHGAGLASAAVTHGARVRHRYGLPGAREHAIDGFPVLFGTTLPQMQLALSAGASADAAGLHALLATMAVLPDTNLVHRGGPEGLQWARSQAGRFVSAGGVFQPCWQDRLARLGEGFVARRLSPGGSADLLAAAWLLLDLHAVANGAVRRPVRARVSVA
jgi:triphosphoribosyl-dephospho-CoA synthase